MLRSSSVRKITVQHTPERYVSVVWLCLLLFKDMLISCQSVTTPRTSVQFYMYGKTANGPCVYPMQRIGACVESCHLHAPGWKIAWIDLCMQCLQACTPRPPIDHLFLLTCLHTWLKPQRENRPHKSFNTLICFPSCLQLMQAHRCPIAVW